VAELSRQTDVHSCPQWCLCFCCIVRRWASRICTIQMSFPSHIQGGPKHRTIF